jgi:hypothetical protein
MSERACVKKPRYRYVKNYIDNRGLPRLYFRRRGYPTVALPEPVDGPEFKLVYAAALNAPPVSPSSLRGGVIAKSKGERWHEMKPPLIGVYLLIHKGQIVYVGSSLDMPIRVAAHKTNGRPFDQVFYIATSARQREVLERLLIRAIDPPQNRQHRPPVERSVYKSV